MIHIVFQPSDAVALRQAIVLDSTLKGDVIEILDDWAVGPIKDIYSEEGISLRKLWWTKVLTGGDYEHLVENGPMDKDQQTVMHLIERLTVEPQESAWIWAAPNAHDLSGYYWLVSQLKALQGRIYILYLNNLPFINNKGHIFYPVYLFEIPPREFLKARKLARPITTGEFEVDTDEWQKLANEQKGVRILEGGKKLQQFGDDYYDAELKNFITVDWQKASKVIQHFLSRAKQTTGDAFLLWRLKRIIDSQPMEVQGDIKKMKDFEIKSKRMVTAAEGMPG